MSELQINNKRIAKNTLFLYLRMIIVMGINLYVVRAVLDLLGVVDYGIYNVVGGVVAMFSFINGTLATSSQRFFSIELAKGDYKRLNEWFCLNILIFVFFIIIFIFIAESLGLWFVNTQMTIPDERLVAANIVFQLSIVTFCVSFYSIPYNALIIAHEQMSAFAYISIIEALFKVVIIYVLTISSWDKLIIYSILMLISSFGVTISYIMYCRIKYKESRFKIYYNSNELRDLFNFSSWHLLGTLSIVIRGQGINLLINMFFNPAVNAARAIAYQIEGAVNQLHSNFFIAVKPQIYKAYANKNMEGLHILTIRSTIICVFLVSVLVFPILLNTDYILNLWLKDVPDYCVLFTQLVLINCLIDSTSNSTISPAIASGRLRRFYLYTGTLYILNLPISYVFLRNGNPPQYVMFVSIIISIVSVYLRAYLLIDIINYPFRKYCIVIAKLVVVSCIIFGCTYLLSLSFDNLLRLLVVTFLSSVFHIFIYYHYILNSEDKIVVRNRVFKIINNFGR